MLYPDYIGALFPCSLLRTRKIRGLPFQLGKAIFVIRAFDVEVEGSGRMHLFCNLGGTPSNSDSTRVLSYYYTFLLYHYYRVGGVLVMYISVLSRCRPSSLDLTHHLTGS